MKAPPRAAGGRDAPGKRPGSIRRKLLLASFILVGISATAGSFAFLIWAWPRLPPLDARAATRGEKLLDVGLLGLFVVHEALFVLPTLHRFLHRKLGGCERAVAAFSKGALLVLLAIFWVPWGEGGLTRSGILLWFSRGVFSLGVLLHLTATSAIGNEFLLGFDAIRRRMEGRADHPPEVARIVLKGPYASLRHPRRLAAIILLACGALFERERLILGAGAALWMLAGAWVEEARLARLGGEAYASYRSRTGFLLPKRAGSGPISRGSGESDRGAGG